MTDYEFTLQDRIAKIRAINEQYDLEHNAYISFSGGKDSTILHYLIDMALPNNKIPRVYMNTGVEYKLVRLFVKDLASKDDRFIILNQTRNIKQTLEKYGYPFKSKLHSHYLNIYFHSGETKSTRTYLGKELTNKGNLRKGQFLCPTELHYQFSKSFKLHCSDMCCQKLKKDLAKKWQKENNKTITITGMRKDEGGSRLTLTCLTNNNTKFHPLSVVDEEWENEFIENNNIKLCDLYYPPYNFKRTGCVGCPFNLELLEDLEVMKQLLPNEYKRANLLWKPVYDEYKRIGYRLSNKIDQLSIFDLGVDYETKNKK